MTYIKEMPMISLWQPWASAVVTPHPMFPQRGIKEFETRHWTTDRRDRVLIHAAKKWDKETIKQCNENPSIKRYRDVFKGEYPLGALIGSVFIEEIITSLAFQHDGKKFSKTPIDEFYLGDWSPLRYGWRLSFPILFDEPIPFRGQQTPFSPVPASVIPEKYRF